MFEKDEVKEIAEKYGNITTLLYDILNPTYHYLQSRSPVERAAALGLRQLAQDLDLSVVANEGEPLTKADKIRLKQHEKAIKFQENKILNEDPTIAQFFNKELKEPYDLLLKFYDNNGLITKAFMETPKFVVNDPDLFKKAEAYKEVYAAETVKKRADQSARDKAKVKK